MSFFYSSRGGLRSRLFSQAQVHTPLSSFSCGGLVRPETKRLISDSRYLSTQMKSLRIAQFECKKWCFTTKCGCLVVFSPGGPWYTQPRVIFHQGRHILHPLPITQSEAADYLDRSLTFVEAYPEIVCEYFSRALCTHVFSP